MNARRELQALATTLRVRGVALTLVAIAALAWPEQTLVDAMTATAVFALLTALYELTVAYDIRHRVKHWWLVAAHAITILAFGVLSLEAPRTLLRAPAPTLAALDLWLLLSAGVAIAMAAYVWSMRGTRWGLLAYAATDIALAVFASSEPALTIFSLLYFGALYAGILGVVEFAAGVFVHRAIRGSHRAFTRRFAAAT